MTHHLAMLGALVLVLCAIPATLSTLIDCRNGVAEFRDTQTRKVFLFAGVALFVFLLGCFSGG